MTSIVETYDLSKAFGSVTALDQVTTALSAGSVVGLVGRNGSGKTTLLHHMTGLALPTAGRCLTFGVQAADLGAAELSRLGVVHQEATLLTWMTVRQHLRYVASFYTRWDRGREERLLRTLDLDREAIIATLSPGNLQKLAVILAIGHHPDLLLLDEPASGLDPIAREALLELLLDLAREDGTTIVVSSHQLHDIERIVDWVVCLEKGQLKANAPLDELKEQFGEWIVTSAGRPLPEQFAERFILKQDVGSRQARLVVRAAGEEVEPFSARHQVSIEARPMNLESMFPFLITGEGS